MQGRLDSDLSKLGRVVRVLVADDDPQNRELIEEVCRSEGFEVEGVGAGDRALEAARGRTFDLVLLDAAMPGMDGLEVCRLLKADPETASIPVMIVTASLEDAVRDRATELGAAAFITKPFRIFELTQRMRADAAEANPQRRRSADRATHQAASQASRRAVGASISFDAALAAAAGD